jgi:L-alanine-DL-glutamate epimerase-like enolase superfamily enzyme
VTDRKPSLSVRVERWPVAGVFAISRGAKTEATVVVAEITDGIHRGRGECVPYVRYGESTEAVARAIEAKADDVRDGLDVASLQSAMPAGGARSALDCALWDFTAKSSRRPVHELLGAPAPQPVTTAYTVSLGTPEEMGQAAGKVSSRPLLKIKLGGTGDIERLAAVRRAAPRCELIVDANEGWAADNLTESLALCARAGVVLVEQPLPSNRDGALSGLRRPIPVCADESAHTRASLPTLRGKYDAVNIKLDKAGGLTEAIAMAREARELGFIVMVGCMVATSLSMAPAILVAQHAHVVDLDGAMLLQRDRTPGLVYENGLVYPAEPALWG